MAIVKKVCECDKLNVVGLYISLLEKNLPHWLRAAAWERRGCDSFNLKDQPVL